MKTYDEALTIIVNAINKLDSIQIPIENAIQYVLKQNVISSIDVVPYRNSAMDGFAVAYKDIKSIPATFPIRAISYAGDNNTYTYEPNTALKIMTGAPVPEGYDTIIRIEDTIFDEYEVTFNIEIEKGQNVRLPGEDIKKDDILFNSGQVLNPLHIGLLASIGLREVSVIRKPKILILSTGNELIEPGHPLSFGKTYDSNSYTIRSMLAPLCDTITVDPILLDEWDKFSESLSQNYDVIITSGGVSTGDKDYIPQIAKKSGWVELLHKAAIKPGKPIFFAKRKSQYLFGLPGNPLSTAITCAIFVIPALKKMIGIEDFLLKPAKVILNQDSIRKSDRTLIWPGRILFENGKLKASFSDKKSSAALSALLESDGLIFQYPEEENIRKIEFATWQQIQNI